MKDYNVRSATLDDLEELLVFEQGIISFERAYDSTLAKDPITYYDLSKLITYDDAEVVLVEFDSQLIASGYAKIKQALPYLKHKKYAYLGFMYTHADYRGKGVNSLVIDWLKEWSATKGLQEIRLTVYNDNVAAIKAYEKVGFTKHLIEMRIK